MKSKNLYILLVLFIFACKKSSVTDNPVNPPNSGGTVHTAPDTSFVTAYVSGSRMNVTKIVYNRSSGSFNFTARNDLQKIDVYCFHFYEPNRWNYQYSDSINYSKREDLLSTWSTISAKHWPDVYFNCCAGPLTDKIIDGTFSARIPDGESDFKIDGSFHLIF